MLTRREFAGCVASAAIARAAALPGSILVHEHILVDFIGADAIKPGRYNADEVFRLALPKLKEIAALGCRRFLDCTPNFLGRDPRLLQRLAGASGIEIWTNTGLYSARQHKFLPAYAKTETAAQIAKRWAAEWRNGVDGVKPRFIKIGVNNGPLDDLDRKIVEAAALASKETGLTFASHTGNGIAALEEVEIVQKAGGATSKFVWVHAYREKDHAIHEKVARAGAWVEFDGLGDKSADWHLECIRHMGKAGLLNRTLLSQDSGWYHVGEPGGGNFRNYSFLYTGFLPRLTAAEAKQLLIDNPVAAYGP
ncbi:MAG: phosphotriesterase [Bryobacteraceae bacterium]